jgi:hypothetical protein
MGFLTKRRESQLAIPEGHEGIPLRIVGDAGIAAAPVGDGRMIPLVILDTSNRADLEEFIRVHGYLGPGDVKMQWGTIAKSENVILILRFERPMELACVIEFDAQASACVIDQVLRMRALYVQSGREGDRFSTTVDAPRVLIEIPETGFGRMWEPMFHRQIFRRMRMKRLPRAAARTAAKDFIKEWRSGFGALRV